MKCPHCRELITVTISRARHAVRGPSPSQSQQRAEQSFAQERAAQVARDLAAFQANNPHYSPPAPPQEAPAPLKQIMRTKTSTLSGTGPRGGDSKPRDRYE